MSAHIALFTVHRQNTEGNIDTIFSSTPADSSCTDGKIIDKHSKISKYYLPHFKLKKIIWSSIERYANHRVFARIILLEVRNSEGYFQSEAYGLVQQFNRIIIGIINEGIASGEIRDTLPPAYIRNAIFGTIEHSCLNRVFFNEEVSTAEAARFITDLLFEGYKAIVAEVGLYQAKFRNKNQPKGSKP